MLMEQYLRSRVKVKIFPDTFGRSFQDGTKIKRSSEQKRLKKKRGLGRFPELISGQMQGAGYLQGRRLPN